MTNTKKLTKEELINRATALGIKTDGLTRNQLIDAIKTASPAADKTAKAAERAAKKEAEKAKKEAERAAKKAAKTFDAMKDRLPKLMGAEYTEPRHGGVLVRYGKERVFRYTGTRLICTGAKYLAGVEGAKYLEKSGYYEVSPVTTAAIFQIYYNVATATR